ncbi:hypothetical protein [Saccharopolyspora sp. CA-218241]|uniref:hypothetical protein n=1 Tax=Saccharopolyspora sp. CA-218241 TaxID=3240027 RepID=UPI003D99A894
MAERGPDPLALVAGLLTLAVSGYLLLGLTWDLRWALGAGAVLLGGAFLIASLARQ